MTRPRWKRIALWTLAILLMLLLAAGLWFRQSPYYAALTLFADGHRAEHFRNMDRIFPTRLVPRGEDVWTLPVAPRTLTTTYTFRGEERDLGAFLDRTETTGLLVLHRGRIVHEVYRLGADETSLFTSWSVAKSVLGVLIGIALDEGAIADVRDPIGLYVPALAGSGYANVPIEDVLTMSSGVHFDEDYENPRSDINMLFVRAMVHGTPLEESIAALESVRPPGTFNEYISSDSMALGLVLEAATGMRLADYLSSRLWAPMGAETDATWNTDRTGREFALCCLNATLRDYARFGQLVLQGGARDERSIVPTSWLEASVNPVAPHLQPGENPASSWTFGYGYKWWLPEEPQGDFTAIGVWGQYVYVNPAREVVIVKTSTDPAFDDNDHETIAAFRAIVEGLAIEE
ncbi:MAG: class C beta-lactamase-related serine hydrolase [Deltaproteobacteria bacterium]|nr:MAG: class C beta-lactamase-related serine hydrolase [Deltaproteobacteria bacterium]